MAYDGIGRFKINNNSRLTINNVRITHFMKGKDYADKNEVLVINELGAGKHLDGQSFHSRKNKNDHWLVEFTNDEGAWMSLDLDASMAEKYDPDKYELQITDESFYFIAKEKSSSSEYKKDKRIVTIFEGTRSKAA